MIKLVTASNYSHIALIVKVRLLCGSPFLIETN